MFPSGCFAGEYTCTAKEAIAKDGDLDGGYADSLCITRLTCHPPVDSSKLAQGGHWQRAFIHSLIRTDATIQVLHGAVLRDRFNLSDTGSWKR